jgi:hypothetical protein
MSSLSTEHTSHLMPSQGRWFDGADDDDGEADGKEDGAKDEDGDWVGEESREADEFRLEEVLKVTVVAIAATTIAVTATRMTAVRRWSRRLPYDGSPTLETASSGGKVLLRHRRRINENREDRLRFENHVWFSRGRGAPMVEATRLSWSLLMVRQREEGQGLPELEREPKGRREPPNTPRGAAPRSFAAAAASAPCRRRRRRQMIDSCAAWCRCRLSWLDLTPPDVTMLAWRLAVRRLGSSAS